MIGCGQMHLSKSMKSNLIYAIRRSACTPISTRRNPVRCFIQLRFVQCVDAFRLIFLLWVSAELWLRRIDVTFVFRSKTKSAENDLRFLVWHLGRIVGCWAGNWQSRSCLFRWWRTKFSIECETIFSVQERPRDVSPNVSTEFTLFILRVFSFFPSSIIIQSDIPIENTIW